MSTRRTYFSNESEFRIVIKSNHEILGFPIAAMIISDSVETGSEQVLGKSPTEIRVSGTEVAVWLQKNIDFESPGVTLEVFKNGSLIARGETFARNGTLNLAVE